MEWLKDNINKENFYYYAIIGIGLCVLLYFVFKWMIKGIIYFASEIDILSVAIVALVMYALALKLIRVIKK